LKAIILAAGEGKRLNMQSDNLPKCLLKINGKTLLERLLNQLFSIEIDDITLVVGYKKELIIDLIGELNINVKIIENDSYKKDTNILSLALALEDRLSPFYLFEADCIFDNNCINKIFDPLFIDRSIWFSKGMFTQNQNGGIIKADINRKVNDLRIVQNYDSKFSSYNKLIGVMKVGKHEISDYSTYLFQACKDNTKQYYHIPWIKNIANLNSYLCDFGDSLVASINNPSDYQLAVELFKNETS